MENPSATAVGISLIGISIILQISCFALMCWLTSKRKGGQTVAMRSWLFIASTFDQTILLIFHLQYHYLIIPDCSIQFCIVLRVISAFASTSTMMWMVMVAVGYFMSTLNPGNRFYLNSRFLSHCVTWSWSVIGCIIYVVVTFLTVNGGRSYMQEPCWNDIGETVHMYFMHGYETIGLIGMIICAIGTRCRVASRRHLVLRQTKPRRQPEYHLEYDVNILLCLCLSLCVYYSALFTRLILYKSGSDLSLMAVKSTKVVIIALFMCFLNKYIIALLRCDLEKAPREYHSRRSQGSLVSNSSLRTTRSSNTSKFVFD